MKIQSFFCFLFLLTASCATTSDRHREGSNEGQEVNLTVAQEEQLTKEALKEMRKDYPPVNDAILQNYVRSLGRKLVNANKLHKRPYTYSFTVVDVAYVNAFALPAGTVFVTAPLIAMAGSEAELAGVIGHEIGHIQARHTAERMYQQEKQKTKGILMGAGGAILGGLAGYGVGKLVCRDGDTTCMAKATLGGGALGTLGGLLVHKYGFMKNSREDEMEADRIGFKIATRAGYDKNQIGKFYERLLAMEKQGKGSSNKLLAAVSDAMSTHPPSEERVAQMKEMAQEFQQGKSIRSTEEFMIAKQEASVIASRHKSK